MYRLLDYFHDNCGNNIRMLEAIPCFDTNKRNNYFHLVWAYLFKRTVRNVHIRKFGTDKIFVNT